MNEQEKKTYLERYKEAKANGVPFFPDIIFKDTVAVLILFIILVALAYFIGAPVEARADPNDTTYTPRPEWYFLFLFQLLKYFPGNLEVIGAMILPGLFILLLIILPFIDKSPKRHFMNRPFASISALLIIAGIGTLTFLSVKEAPPPQQAVAVDQAAALYAKNCANCHGAGIAVPVGADLHQIIAAGNHEGMPAWGGDLSTDEIDALAGFILSPNGSRLYTQYCATCHTKKLEAAGDPLEMQRVLDEGASYPSHQGLGVSDWQKTLTTNEQNALLNFMAAPDGQRLFTINCSGCHGQGVSFTGTEDELRELIANGGQHLDMPAWKGTLSVADLDTLAAYVVDPKSVTAGASLFGQHCASCHGEKVPPAPDKASARKIISSGGGHITMPVWGDILTPEQLNALVKYTLDASKGTGSAVGAQIFAENCKVCHGPYGEGGPNPTRLDDIIAPISSAEYLKTRDDATLRNIVSQGQPDFGMSPFGASNGGPLSSDQIDAVVAFIRSWEANPPVELPVTLNANNPTGSTQSTLNGAQIFTDVCSSCHGLQGEGSLGPALNTQEFQSRYDDQAMFDVINSGHDATAMIAWGDLLTSTQIQQLVQYIRSFNPNTAGSIGTPSAVSFFSGRVAPIFEAKCAMCHNSQTTFGGWDSSSYSSIMTSGNNGPVITAGDTANSLLVQRLLGKQGGFMPPSGQLSENELQIILYWITIGAPEN
jgi:mono/diheme cytochrome c family protein